MVKNAWDKQCDRFGWTHSHTFDDAIPVEKRREWLEQSLQRAGLQLDKASFIVNETDKGFDFNFMNIEEYTAFVIAIEGDMYGKEKHVHTHRFANSNTINPHWVQAAEAYLKAMNIDYKLEMNGNEASFKFDRFSDSMIFQRLINEGHIDFMAMDLEYQASIRDMIKRYEATRLDFGNNGLG